MEKLDHANYAHRRFNPLTGDWVLVCPHRAKRPWQGQVEKASQDVLPAYDEQCYLCAGNRRANGAVNPDYIGPYVFDNDFAALQQNSPSFSQADDLFRCESVTGTSRVVCYSERHDLTLPLMTEAQIQALIGTWCDEYRVLMQRYCWIQIFENKGAINGCSNPHPHGQIWASNSLPTLVAREDQHQRDYFENKDSVLLLDYANRELDIDERIVCSNPSWVVVVPWWASWPFETLLLPLQSVARIIDLNNTQKRHLAEILKQLTIRYDNLFATSFPYSMGWHGAPGSGEEAVIDNYHWQLHAHFYPPLLRSASVKKFMVGYEMLCEAQRDLTPEQAAKRLREQATVHYTLGTEAGER